VYFQLIVLPDASQACGACPLGLQAALYSVRPTDPVSSSATVVAVVIIAATTGSPPVWRAVRTDPAIILRDE
jgi:hypothetical protein